MSDPITAPASKVPPHLQIQRDGEIYGLRVKKGDSALKLELQCYKTDRGKDKGGLGAHEHFRRAWRLAWPNFAWNEWVEMLTWAWCAYKVTCVIGHTRASKTYGTAHAAYLDYCAAPFETMTSMTTVTFEGLRVRMWADLTAAIENASFPCAFNLRTTDNILRLDHGGEDREQDEKFIIDGFATARTGDAAGRIQGKHARRRRVILDEAQELPPAIYRALANARSAPDFKGSLLANPVERQSDFGNYCEPKLGWAAIHDTDLFWETKDGNICLHFDGLQSPNVKAGKVIFDFLIRPDYIEDIRRTYGEDSLEWWMYVRGFFPPDGTVARAWPDVLIERAKPQLMFDFPGTPCATLDPAFEHDECVLIRGEYGKLRNGHNAVNALETRVIKTKTGKAYKPKDYQIAEQVKEICEEWGVKPIDFIMDKTGGGRGVFAIMQVQWSYDIHGIEYGGEATERVLKQGETDKCCDIYQKFVTELWFRGRAWAEEGMVGGLGVLNPKTAEDLNTRRYTVRTHKDRKKVVIESKEEMKKRLGRSPDHGDAFSQFFELMTRKGLLPGNRVSQGLRSKWDRARTSARRALQRWSDDKEFSFH